jgi:ABC-type multidrug transport system ATPase subunit
MLILGRALIGEPSLLLMDEPFLGLSREIRDRFVSVIETTLKGRVTILMAEHDAETGFRVMDRLAIFRGGALVHEGTRAETADAHALVELLHRHFRPEKGKEHRMSATAAGTTAGGARAGDGAAAEGDGPTG